MPELIVTELTNIGTHHCVAAWDNDSKKMVRPMPDSNYWPEALVARYGLQVGSVFECEYVEGLNRNFPHKTEDQQISSASITVTGHNFWARNSFRPPSNKSIAEVFDNYVRQQSAWNRKKKVYVPEGTKCRSLGSVEVASAKFEFFEERYHDDPPKLRACVRESILNAYNLSVTCSSIRNQWSSDGVKQLNKFFRSHPTLHLRIGLATAFSGMPEKCSVQLNGIIC